MKVVILGGSGMLGHKVVQAFAPVARTVVTSRASLPPGLAPALEAISGVDVSRFEATERILETQRPDVVVNCIGIVKQLAEGRDPVASIEINSLFPHRVARACRSIGARLIHVSTDCVFSGRHGRYVEGDFPDASDLYGRTKLLGEVGDEGAITLRTSIVGREIRATSGLVEWFLSNRGGVVEGYTEAIFSGLTTAELARVILRVARDHAGLAGVYHVSAEPISKFDLLTLVNDAFRANVTIRASSEVRIDRSLDSSRFRNATGWHPPVWPAMICELADDPTPYDDWRRSQ